MECKQIYNSGLRAYVLDNNNWVDFTLLSLYTASYALRFLVDYWVKEADAHFDVTSKIRQLLMTDNRTYINVSIIMDVWDTSSSYSYFMKACK